MVAPKLRFQEFDGDWESKKLKDLTDILKYEKSFFIVITEKTVALASPATMPYIEYTGLKQLPPSDSIAYIR